MHYVIGARFSFNYNVTKFVLLLIYANKISVPFKECFVLCAEELRKYTHILEASLASPDQDFTQDDNEWIKMEADIGIGRLS
jgi:hypothetical protein